LGPGAAALSVDGGASSGILRHTGAGTLGVSALTITHGHHESAGAPLGGCLYSAGNIELTDATVSYCAAVGTDAAVTLGGAVYTQGDLSLLRTLVTDSHAQGMASGAHGGGVYVRGNFTATDSAISRNLAYGAPINGGQGGGAMIAGTTMLLRTTISDNGSFSVGGLYTMGEVTIDSSTISGNSASHAAGMRAIYTTGLPTATIVNSTITGNHAFATVGGLNLIIPAKIANTTIALNEALNGLAGVLMSGPTLELESTIIAGNIGFNVPDDFQVYGSPVITGANNLVGDAAFRHIAERSLARCARRLRRSDADDPADGRQPGDRHRQQCRASGNRPARRWLPARGRDERGHRRFRSAERQRRHLQGRLRSAVDASWFCQREHRCVRRGRAAAMLFSRTASKHRRCVEVP
jgi:hypothetical protein